MTLFKPPKALGTCADKLYEIRQQRLAAQKVVEKLTEQETALKEHIIQTLPKSESSGITGKVARVTIVKKIIPQVADWDKLYKHISRTKSFELLQRRVSDTAVKERWENGKQVPGVDHFTIVTVGINKI